jgi:YVTN family beta-propeller protein
MTEAGDSALLLATDAAVIQRSWREPELFAIVFDRHAPFIHRYVHRRVGREAADDLVAETFLTAFGKRNRYDVSYPDARPWLYGIATNFVNRHRREEIRQYRIRLAALPDLDVPSHAERVATNKPGKPIKVGSGPDSIAITPDGRAVYVANTFSGSVTPIATATNTAGPPIKVGGFPTDIAFAP